MQYLIANGPMQTTASFAVVTTGTNIKTLLQVKGLVAFKIVAWGISFDGAAAATPGMIELIETGSVFGTVTASVANDITQLDGEAKQLGDPTSTLISVGTSATGYTCTSEGSITAVRNLSGPQLIAPTNQFIEPFAYGDRPYVPVGTAMRIRVKFGTAVNAYAWVKIEF